MTDRDEELARKGIDGRDYGPIDSYTENALVASLVPIIRQARREGELAMRERAAGLVENGCEVPIDDDDAYLFPGDPGVADRIRNLAPEAKP